MLQGRHQHVLALFDTRNRALTHTHGEREIVLRVAGGLAQIPKGGNRVDMDLNRLPVCAVSVVFRGSVGGCRHCLHGLLGHKVLCFRSHRKAHSICFQVNMQPATYWSIFTRPRLGFRRILYRMAACNGPSIKSGNSCLRSTPVRSAPRRVIWARRNPPSARPSRCLKPIWVSNCSTARAVPCSSPMPVRCCFWKPGSCCVRQKG